MGIGTKTESMMHDKIHASEAFGVSTYFTSVATAATRSFLILNGEHQLHTLFVATAGNGADLIAELFETPTYSAVGTPLTINNRRLSSTKTSGASCYHTPTVSVAGTQKFARVIPFGQPATPSVADRLEWILTPNTNYLFRVTNKGSTALIGMSLSFYIVRG